MTQKTYRLGNIEMLVQVIEPGTFRATLRACRELGPGWRLPTLEECEWLQELYRLGVGGMQVSNEGGYWACGPRETFASSTTWDPADSDLFWDPTDPEAVRPARAVREI